MMNFELTPRRAVVLTALLNEPGHEIQDSDGQATALLMTETKHRTTNALSGVLMQLEQAGLIEREIGGRRTYRIALTRKGVRAAESLVKGETPEPYQGDAESTADAIIEGSVDLDLLAGVLLKKALIATQAQEGSADLSERLRRAEERAAKAQAKVAELEDELTKVRGRIAELEAVRKTLEHNNSVLAANIDKVKKAPGTPIQELISKKEQLELEKLMRALPSNR